MRPYIICHMMASLDGRIDCDMTEKISGDEYYEALETLGCQSELNGRVTTPGPSSKEVSRISPNTRISLSAVPSGGLSPP